MVILSYILLIIAVAGAGIALIITAATACAGIIIGVVNSDRS